MLRRRKSHETDYVDLDEVSACSDEDIFGMDVEDSTAAYAQHEGGRNSSVDAEFDSEETELPDTYEEPEKDAVSYSSVDDDELPDDEETARLLSAADSGSLEDPYEHVAHAPGAVPKKKVKIKSKSKKLINADAVVNKKLKIPITLDEDDDGTSVPAFTATEITADTQLEVLKADEAMHYHAILSRLRSAWKFACSVDDVCKLAITTDKLLSSRHETITGQRRTKEEGGKGDKGFLEPL